MAQLYGRIKGIGIIQSLIGTVTISLGVYLYFTDSDWLSGIKDIELVFAGIVAFLMLIGGIGLYSAGLLLKDMVEWAMEHQDSHFQDENVARAKEARAIRGRSKKRKGFLSPVTSFPRALVGAVGGIFSKRKTKENGALGEEIHEDDE